MDYEKAYKEALERAKEINNERKAQPFDVMTRVFSELREESEDEKIRKEIIYHIQNCDDTIDEVTEKRMVAWLEKQGEQKSINDTDEEIVNAVKDTSVLDLVEPKPTWSREDEQNLNAALSYIDDEYLRRWLKDVIYNKYENPVWSEEDELMLLSTIQSLELTNGAAQIKIDWLKSLKERVKPQWKPENIHLEALRCVINGNNLDVIALKDLLEQLKKLEL